MAMDLNAFLAAALAPREQAVEVPELAAWFAEGEPAVWTVRGLSAAELGRAKEACARGLDNIRALVEAMAGDGNGDKAASIRRAFGLSTDDVPEDVSRRIEMLAAASVSPAIGPENRDVIVKLAESFPTTFYRLSNTVDALTGQGAVEGKPKRSGASPE